MSRYRTYKNGITGYRYKGYYIIRGEQKGQFQIWQEDKSVYQDGIYNGEDCEWIIDMALATSEEMSLIRKLYGMTIYQINQLRTKLDIKSQNSQLTPIESAVFVWAPKIIRRKAKDRPMTIGRQNNG